MAADNFLSWPSDWLRDQVRSGHHYQHVVMYFLYVTSCGDFRGGFPSKNINIFGYRLSTGALSYVAESV